MRSLIAILCTTALAACGSSSTDFSNSVGVSSPAVAQPIRCPLGTVRKGNRCITVAPAPAPAPTPAPAPAPVVTCPDGSTAATLADCPPPPPPPPPATQTCPDGSVIPTTSTCPAPTPVPVPAPAPIDPPGSANDPIVGTGPGLGAPDIPTTDHDVMQDITPFGPAPANTNDVVGAFRFVCRSTRLLYDDHVVFYQQPGKSHLHNETGVYGWSAFSNYGNLRVSGGGSGCNQVAEADDLNQPVIANDPKLTYSANRTPYETPALLDGKGNVILPDFAEFYYKRRPATDPIVSDPANPQYQGKAVKLPNGIKFIFGADLRTHTPAVFQYQCVYGNVDSVLSFKDAIACVKANASAGAQLWVRGNAPDCWDGVNLDSADHRSHVAYGSYGSWGYYKCDAAHPFVIPMFTLIQAYTILPSDDGDIHWSSDEMDLTQPRGWSIHADYGPAAWGPLVLAMWTDNCIDKKLNCSAGDLGNGFGLKGAGEPIYNINGVYTASWKNPVRLVPVPPMPAM